jgi:RimJ/RimL family protein N-acetyltransferase
MEKFMLFIKHRVGFVWNIIEVGNDIVFNIFFKSILEKALSLAFINFNQGPYQYRRLTREDAGRLHSLIQNQPSSDLEFFKPHPFDELSIIKQTGKKSFLMMGAFNEDELVGYFFLRFFANNKCFVGRLIDKDFRGKGIGDVMNRIMYETAWRMNFRCLSTISRDNNAVMKAHASNKHMIVLKELKNNYLLVEFLPD